MGNLSRCTYYLSYKGPLSQPRSVIERFMELVKGKAEEHPDSLDSKGNGSELKKHIQRKKMKFPILKGHLKL